MNAFLEVEAAEVAKYMHVSERTVYRYVERYKVTGDVRQCVKNNGPRQLLCEYEELLLVHMYNLFWNIFEGTSANALQLLDVWSMQVPYAGQCIVLV